MGDRKPFDHLPCDLWLGVEPLNLCAQEFCRDVSVRLVLHL